MKLYKVLGKIILSVPKWINYNHISCKIKLKRSHLFICMVVTIRKKLFYITMP